ncbi:CRISPR-associated endonuclease Cas2 [Methylococcus geothermalis]|uniref:CRISPR-associated endoribonuclease Cas2 n=1 Tax=Methylococcus geothermalis TaxID=2681310 RepID=A0A858Q9L8_9GAMM|nr:CRISPR-associated endonuclease Cas2 [Methylococcus geothermalis]QJD30455.1 CRISPR-associated endonuclease Cas2 [Methylococcus geothermalis]
MAHNAPRLHLISYDIADPRRLTRLHRYLSGVGMPLQYSVFVVELSPRKLARVLKSIEDIIDPRRDDVRVYPFPRNGERIRMGRQSFPEGVFLIGQGCDLLSLAKC